MTTNYRHIVPVLLISVLAGWAAGCTDLSDYDRERMEDAISDSLLSVTESRTINMDLIEDGHRIVSVHSPYALTFTRDGETETELQDSVHVTVLDTLGGVKTTVVSKSARYLGRKSEFHFKDDVVVETDEGRRLFTDYLEWSQRDQTIHSPDFVIIVTRSDSITGYGLDGTDDLQDYRLSEVTGEFELESSPASASDSDADSDSESAYETD
ncbi:LPS export ABC transporter periplasmic protein LptC [Natronogracilivirga saccharolytica]|uniref:LPS export ABC transporter periplasmic protein LptC n=1 Tax=Natronogracilivirga saccharolytica TaxID=2812953 RepID=A0A8J7UWK6_9BACT|nr:LPS export ABC transporter periplasmic protein LptC [Natronogracilivirga saccharolytica]